MATNEIDTSPTSNPTVSPQQQHSNDFQDIAGSDDMQAPSSPSDKNNNRRQSNEWDASKVPPSRFQRRKGSIYSTPNSRDGHVKDSTRDQAYWEKLKEKGWTK